MSKNLSGPVNRQGISGVFRDLYSGFIRDEIWRHFAWDEIQNRYRRSVLGIAWIGLSYAFFVIVIVLFFRGATRANPGEFVIYVATGYAAYMFMIGNVTDGCEVFRNSRTWIKSTPMPYSIHIYRSICRSVFSFFIQMIVGLAIMLFFGWRPQIGALLAIPALVIFLVNAVWIQLCFGLFSTRFRDISHLVATVTRLLFFATPIIWVLENRVGVARQLALFNPMTHYVEIFRAPLLGTPMLEQSWPFVITLTVVGWVFTVLAGSIMMKRIPFWL